MNFTCPGCSILIEPWFTGKTYMAFICRKCGYHKSGTIDELTPKKLKKQEKPI